MNIFLDIIAWYCIIMGILAGLACLFGPVGKDWSEAKRTRRSIAWLIHIAFLATGAMILMH